MNIYPTNQLQRIGPVPAMLAQRILPATAQAFFQARAPTRIDKIVATALTGGSSTLTLYHRRMTEQFASAPSLAEALVYLSSLSAHEVRVFDGPFYLGEGESLWAAANSANHITLTVYGSVVEVA